MSAIEFEARDSVRKVALARQVENVQRDIEVAKQAGKTGVHIEEPFPETEKALLDAGFTILSTQWAHLVRVSWSGYAAECEGPFCAHCKCSTENDPAAVDGRLPAYMMGMCSCCFSKKFEGNKYQ
jgi:hypothetical protein